jgi:hypothetical protein
MQIAKTTGEVGTDGVTSLSSQLPDRGLVQMT